MRDRERVVSTWEEHGGDHLWLLQRVDDAALEGLTDGRLQVAEQGEGKGKERGGASEGAGSSSTNFLNGRITA